LISLGLPRATRARLMSAAAAVALALSVSACQVDGPYSAKHMKPLSAEMVSLLEKKQMSKGTPLLVRVFKEEAELEVWKQDASGTFALLKTYPICRWSGQLGPKMKEGDRQAPEGFYNITPTQMNPNSAFYLSFNLGYPNAFDRAHGRTGAHLMVHGDCSSSGCYSMTDEQIAEIFALGREAFFGGQRSFQVQAYPFRMTALNMAKHRNSPHMSFWKNIKEGYDHFEVTRQQPKVDVCEKRYVFNGTESANGGALDFQAAGKCPAYRVPQPIMTEVSAKARRDEQAFVDFVKRNTPTVAVNTGRDGGMHPAFTKIYTSREVRDEKGRLRVVVEKRPLAGPLDYRESSPEQVAALANPTPAAEAPAPADTTTSSTRTVPMPRPAPNRSTRATTTASTPTAVRTTTVRTDAGPNAGPPTAYAAQPQQASSGGFVSNLISSSRESVDRATTSVGRMFGLQQQPAAAPQRPARAARTAPDPRAASRREPPKPAPKAARSEPAKPQPPKADAKAKKPETKPGQRTADAATPVPATAGTISGAAPPVPTGSFSSRFGAANSR
jgi:murein L,D-transpeptidase YafK